MAENPIGSIKENFAGLEDPRIERKKLHKLLDIIIIAICGVICGADNWVDIEMFGIKKEAWLRQFLELQNGIPSHDTFGRVFGLLKADQYIAVIRQMALNLLKNEKTAKGGIQAKRLQAAWDENYLLKVLSV